MHIYLIRHGESEGNIKPNQIGQDENSPLTKYGLTQAYLLRNFLSKENILFDNVFSSPYVRALSTAQIVCSHYASINIVPELREYDPGEWRGKPRDNILTNDVKINMNSFGKRFLPPKGESFLMVERRISAWLDDHVLYEQKLQNCNIALFSHGMTIRCLLHNIMGFDQSFISKIAIENTSITKLSFNDDGWKLLYLNNCSHL